MVDITQTLKDLKEKGVLEILIEYRGGGDSGDIDYPVYKPQNLDNYATHDQTEANELICFVESLLGLGWENGEGSSGSVVFDFDKNIIHHTHEDEIIEYHSSECIYSFDGLEIESTSNSPFSEEVVVTDTEKSSPQEQLKIIEDIDALLVRTSTQRFLLDFWIKYPEIKSVMFEDCYEYDDNGDYFQIIFLSDIEFVSEEAKQGLVDRLNDSDLFDDYSDLETWQRLLLEDCTPDIDGEHIKRTLTRPENPEKEIAAIVDEVRQFISASGVVEQGGVA